MIARWRIVHRRWALEHRWYRVLVEAVDLGDGRIIDDYYLGVFDDVALVVAVTAEWRVLLVRQYKHGAQEVLVELPGGYFAAGETALAAARRELREETGYHSDDWEALGTFCSSPTKERGGRVHLFLARDARRVAVPEFDDLGVIELLEVPTDRAFSAPFLRDITVLGSRLGLELARALVIPPEPEE